jgi:hypothetical protein
MRKTLRPDRAEPIGCQSFRHQLAVVAAGCGQDLWRTSRREATQEVSHLCLNSRCFNPKHVIVESRVLQVETDLADDLDALV